MLVICITMPIVPASQELVRKPISVSSLQTHKKIFLQGDKALLGHAF
jgi:hypothetical protein